MLAATDNGLYDEAAMLTAIGTFITTVVVLVRQRQHKSKLQGIEDTLNHTDQEITTPDGPTTLGQRVVQLQRSLDAGFNENTRVHELLQDGLHQNGQRIDQVRRDLNDTNKKITRLHPEDKEST